MLVLIALIAATVSSALEHGSPTHGSSRAVVYTNLNSESVLSTLGPVLNRYELLINRESIRKIWWNVAPVLIGLIVAVVGFRLPRVLVELDLASMFTAEVTTVDRRFVGHLSALQVFHKLQSGSPVNSLPADRIPLPLFKILEAASAQLHLQVMQGETYNH